MDVSKALSLLRVQVFKDLKDLERQYLAEKEKNRLGYERAANDRMRASYKTRLNEIDEAWKFISENPGALKRRVRAGSAPKLGKKGKIGLVIAVIVLIGLGSLYAVNSYKQSQREKEARGLVEQALFSYRKHNLENDLTALEKAKSLFRQAADLGSPAASFYLGQLTFKEGNRNEGFTMMEQAIEEGFDDPTQIAIFNQLKKAIMSK